jgi:ligand-binding SRPBCC domain-containing protein
MPLIQLTTFIGAPVERVFDLSRSINMHRQSMQSHSEKVVGGKVSGLMQLNDVVVWQAKHIFKARTMKIKITAFNRPYSFIDEQVEGDFRSMKHEHFFKPIENGTIMIDQFYFEAPYGRIGKFLNYIFLIKYMERLLAVRNSFIKETAESIKWKTYIEQ